MLDASLVFQLLQICQHLSFLATASSRVMVSLLVSCCISLCVSSLSDSIDWYPSYLCAASSLSFCLPLFLWFMYASGFLLFTLLKRVKVNYLWVGCFGWAQVMGFFSNLGVADIFSNDAQNIDWFFKSACSFILAKISLAITISAIDEVFWQFFNCELVSGSVPMQLLL